MSVVWDFGNGTIELHGETVTYSYGHAVGAPFTVRATTDMTGATGWVAAPMPVVVPTRAIPWGELSVIAAASGDALATDPGHGTGWQVVVALAYGTPPQGGLFDWLPDGTVKLDVQCSDPAWPHPAFMPLPTADYAGNRIVLSFNDDIGALQVGAPRDVEFHLIGLDDGDVEIWRKSAPFHVDLA